MTLIRLIYFDVFSYGFFGLRNRCLPFLFSWSFWCSWDLLFFFFLLWCLGGFGFGCDWCFFGCFGLFNWLGNWSCWSWLWSFNNGFWSFDYWVSLWSLSNLWLLFNCLCLWGSWICLLFHRGSWSRSWDYWLRRFWGCSYRFYSLPSILINFLKSLLNRSLYSTHRGRSFLRSSNSFLNLAFSRLWCSNSHTCLLVQRLFHLE